MALALGVLLNNIKKKRYIIPALVIIFLVTGWIQLRKHEFKKAKTQNPVYALAGSWLFSEKSPGLFSMKVSQKNIDLIRDLHSPSPNEKIPLTENISHVVFFIMESTPASLLQVYDSTYTVTPNINEWKKHALIYKNIYAHLPNTVNSVFSLTCSTYPLINYKAAVSEYPEIKIKALPQLLRDQSWNTSFFFSSDLEYGNIRKFLRSHGMETAEDLTSIACDRGKFQSNYAQLEGLDDRCIVSRYFSWREKQAGKSFSMLWTNQTHYPYFSNDKIKFTDNAALNPYLNALKNNDEAFNELMKGLEERDQLENTLVVVVGDHGEAFGTHSQFSHASNIYEENLHVPLLLINPVLFKGNYDNRPGGLIDVPPTIMHLLNLPAPAEWQGTSLLGNKIKDHTFFLVPFSDFLFGSRFENWKFIYNATSGTYELYDLSKDPGELNNVANSHPEIVKREYEILAAWVQYHDLMMKGVVEK
jgi:phosphoglycerol transferase MdoB-like AlkP superfamily enzyme